MILLAALFVSSISGSAVTTLAQRGGFIAPGRYEIEIAATGKVLDLRREDMRTVQQWERGGVRNQQWEIEHAGGNYYYIRSAENGASLAIQGAGVGARVIAAGRGNRESNMWRFEELGNGEVMIIHRSGLALDIPNGAWDNSVPMQVWSVARNNNQRFRLVPVGDVARSPYDPVSGRPEYNEGYRAGINDRRASLSSNYRRHRGSYNRQSELEFRQGYAAGYNTGYDPGWNDDSLNRMNATERRYYNDGYRLGRNDARTGYNSNYRRYSNRYDRRLEPFFRRGYEAGYYSVPNTRTSR
jgi:hypothetical protein